MDVAISKRKFSSELNLFVEYQLANNNSSEHGTDTVLEIRLGSERDHMSATVKTLISAAADQLGCDFRPGHVCGELIEPFDWMK